MRPGLLYSRATVSIKLIMPVEITGCVYTLTQGKCVLCLTPWRNTANR